MCEAVERVFDRMMRHTDRVFASDEIESIKRGIKRCLDNGLPKQKRFAIVVTLRNIIPNCRKKQPWHEWLRLPK